MASLRKAQGKTQQQVAEALFVSPKSVSRWESGVGFPDINILQSVADYYGVSVDELLKGEKANPNKEEEQADSTLAAKNRNKDKLVASSLSKKELPIFIVAISLLGACAIIGDVLIPCGYLLVGIIMVLVGVLISLALLLIGDKLVKDSYKLDTSDDTQKGVIMANRTIKERRIYYFDILFITGSVFLALAIPPLGLASRYSLSESFFGVLSNTLGGGLLIASFLGPYFSIRPYFLVGDKERLKNSLQFSMLLLGLFISVTMFFITIHFNDSNGTYASIYPVIEFFVGSQFTLVRGCAIGLFVLQIAAVVIGYIKRWKWLSLSSIVFGVGVGVLCLCDADMIYNAYSTGILPSSYGIISLTLYLVCFIWLTLISKKKKMAA